MTTTDVVRAEAARAVGRPMRPCLPPGLGRRVARIVECLDRPRLLPREPSLTEKERKDLEAVRPAYRAYLEPGPRSEILALVTRLRAHYFVSDVPDALAQALADDWADDLGRYPIWAVKAACDRYRRSEPTRAPKPANIIAFCEEEIEDERRELREVELALTAPPTNPEPTPATPGQVADILEKSGVRKMMDEAEAEKKRPKTRAPIHQRAHDAAMEAFNRERAAEGADGR